MKTLEKNMEKKKQNTEILEVTPTEEIIPLNDIITQELERHNLTEAVLKQMETDFLPLTIEGISDKVGYDSVNKARLACKNTRILTGKLCKSGREQAIFTQKAWIKIEKEIVERIEAVETVLAAKQKVIDDYKNEQKRLAEEAEQKVLQERSVKLTQLGCAFTGDSYNLDDIRISTLQVKTADTFAWSALFAAVETKFKEKEIIRLQEEELREQSAMAAKKLAEENLARQEELNKKQAELEAQQKVIEGAQVKQKIEAERLIQERQEAEKRAKEETLKARKSSLFALGFAQQNQRLSFKDLFFVESELLNSSEEEWNSKIKITSENVNHIKKEIEKQHLLEIERAKQEAINAEHIRLEIIKKQEQEAELKRIAEQRRISNLAPDLDKVKLFLTQIAKITLPDCNTEEFKTYVTYLDKSRKEWLTDVYSKITK